MKKLQDVVFDNSDKFNEVRQVMLKEMKEKSELSTVSGFPETLKAIKDALVANDPDFKINDIDRVGSMSNGSFTLFMSEKASAEIIGEFQEIRIN